MFIFEIPDALEHEELFVGMTQYLKERIMKTRLSDESLRCSFDFILNFIKMKPSQGLELLNSNKKKKSFFYHLVSSSQKIKLNFVEDLVRQIRLDTMRVSSFCLQRMLLCFSGENHSKGKSAIFVRIVNVVGGKQRGLVVRRKLDELLGNTRGVCEVLKR